jgi:hypothetical protein
MNKVKKYIYISEEQYATAKENGISYDMVYQRTHWLDWDVERAITEQPKKYAKPFTLKQLKKIAEMGLTKHTVRKRMQRGNSFNQAVSYGPVHQSKRKKPDPFRKYGFLEKDIAEAEAKGITYYAFRKRIDTHGFTLWEAKNIPKRISRERFYERNPHLLPLKFSEDKRLEGITREGIERECTTLQYG